MPCSLQGGRSPQSSQIAACSYWASASEDRESDESCKARGAKYISFTQSVRSCNAEWFYLMR